MLSKIHCVLTEWKTGKKREVNFSSTAFSSIYDVHLATLETFQKESPGNYRETMTKIYRHASYVISFFSLNCADLNLKGRDHFPAGKGEGSRVVIGVLGLRLGSWRVIVTFLFSSSQFYSALHLPSNSSS